MIRRHDIVVLAAFACICCTIPLLGVNASTSSTRGTSQDVIGHSATAVAALSLAHCEVPCGIYDDHMMVGQMRLDAETIRKASSQIAELSGKLDAASLNTITRWVMVKEEHSRDLQHMNAWYFMTQRVKAVPATDPGHAEYVRRLTAHHRISVAAMKAAQSLDEKDQVALVEAIDAVSGWYPPKDLEGAHDAADGDWVTIAERDRP